MAINTRGGRRRQRRRNKRNAQEQHYGGSKEAADKSRVEFKGVADRGEANANSGIARANTLATTASAHAQKASDNYDRSLTDYRSSRDPTLANAAALESDARTAASTYQQTAEKQFALNQARNQNAAASLGSLGGSAGLRTAMATAGNANADAAAQAEITRAQEYNDLMNRRQAALAQAAGIRAGVGAADQGAAQIATGRQQGLNANVMQSAGLQSQVGTSQQGLGLGASTGLEEAQLGQAATAEASRSAAETARINRWKTLMLPTVGG